MSPDRSTSSRTREIEIINPEEFFTNSFFDDFEVRGINIKQLLKDSIAD